MSSPLSKLQKNRIFENKIKPFKTVSMSCSSLGSKLILISLAFKMQTKRSRNLSVSKQTFFDPVYGVHIPELD